MVKTSAKLSSFWKTSALLLHSQQSFSLKRTFDLLLEIAKQLTLGNCSSATLRLDLDQDLFALQNNLSQQSLHSDANHFLIFLQVMLYVDGMNGVMKHGPTVQWLYTLIASKYRLVVKTALKLLLVFVEYCEGNCYLLVNAIKAVDCARGTLPWTNIMK